MKFFIFSNLDDNIGINFRNKSDGNLFGQVVDFCQKLKGGSGPYKNLKSVLRIPKKGNWKSDFGSKNRSDLEYLLGFWLPLV